MKFLPLNLFKDIPDSLPKELIEVLSENKNVRIERILSRGHASPEGFWYDQDKDEFVVLLKGEAGLAFADGDKEVVLSAGDSLHIPAHVKHRVAWTSEGEETLWLAIHY